MNFEREALAVLEKHEGVSVWYTIQEGGRAHLEAVWSEKERRSGAGGRALRELFLAADKHGITFTLVPRWLTYDLDRCDDEAEIDRLHGLNELRLSNEQLRAWYERLGFIGTGARDGDDEVMERLPAGA